MNRNCRLILQSFFQCLNCFCIFLFNCKNCFRSIRNLHTVFHTADYFVTFFFNLLNVVAKSRFTLCCINQNISTLKVCAKFYSCWESGTAHTNYSGSFHHIKLASFFNWYEFIFLFLVRFNNDSVFRHFNNFTVCTGKNISAKPCWCCNQSSFFHSVAGFYNRFTRCTYMLS